MHKSDKTGQEMVTVCADLLAGPAGILQKMKSLVQLLNQTENGLAVQDERLRERGVPPTPRTEDAAVANELVQVSPEGFRRANKFAISQPLANRGQSEVLVLGGEAGQALVTEQALYIGSFAGGHGNRFLGIFRQFFQTYLYIFWVNTQLEFVFEKICF